MFSNVLKLQTIVKKLSLVVALLFLATGCFDKKTTKRTTATQQQTTTPNTNGNGGIIFFPTITPTPTATANTGGSGGSYGTGNEPGVSDGGQTIDYYKINNPPIVIHGGNDGVVTWSSETNLPAGMSQEILTTDARLNVRVIPRRQYFGVDSKGVPCQYQPQAYQKLQVGVQVRKKESPSASAYHLFDNVSVNGASKVHEFSVPENTNFPLVLEILNVKWDYSCIYYSNQGYNVPEVCPWDRVWTTECVQIELQFSTDGTKDIPGERTY